jgi:hypothetical protein
MSVQNSCFQFEDFLGDELPLPGYYPCSITSARFRRSAKDNRMLQVLYTLEGTGSAPPMVADYFVLEGPRVSPSGIVLSRRRLVELYRACGLDPQEGQSITPAALVDARLQVRVEHEHWEGRPRLRVVAYRPLERLDSEQEPIPF